MGTLARRPKRASRGPNMAQKGPVLGPLLGLLSTPSPGTRVIGPSGRPPSQRAQKGVQKGVQKGACFGPVLDPLLGPLGWGGPKRGLQEGAGGRGPKRGQKGVPKQALFGPFWTPFWAPGRRPPNNPWNSLSQGLSWPGWPKGPKRGSKYPFWAYEPLPGLYRPKTGCFWASFGAFWGPWGTPPKGPLLGVQIGGLRGDMRISLIFGPSEPDVQKGPKKGSKSGHLGVQNPRCLGMKWPKTGVPKRGQKKMPKTAKNGFWGPSSSRVKLTP